MFHKVDLKNEFFKKIIQEGKIVFHGKRCVWCQEFLPTSKFKINHDFLKHGNGRNVVEEQAVRATNIDTVQSLKLHFRNILLVTISITLKVC